MTFDELRSKLTNEDVNSIDVTEVRDAIADADEIIKSLNTRINDLQADFDETKDALDKARILNAKYYNNAIEVVNDTVEREKEDKKYFATDEEMREAFN